MKKLGLIGFPLTHSFSKKYFQEKFLRENLQDYSYELYPLENIQQFSQLLTQHPELIGLNVTIPYKEQILPFLDEISENAQKIGAINTIAIQNGKKIGYNTDYEGFLVSLQNFLQDEKPKKALILGTGGASKAVQAVLEFLQIPFQLVSRKKGTSLLSYEELTPQIIENASLIINTTPLGMYPETNTYPPLPYESINQKHFLYDLVYNPEFTLFLQKGKARGAKIKNGLEMLYLQAEAAWDIWKEI
ncbi:shikimate dehydrogenase family protein [Raineya orbicola]|uniref:Shikimate 5-dehydrogenase n=1 Tax=Raineya orbicola TaxID=2016530 RepID=A0A2N3IJR4_9BACT|nr:shikimate dehydrogenase [Raineya orbicola]PKQ70511.1 Shikimate 5-dehydrogenase [Raineya orbicola]